MTSLGSAIRALRTRVGLSQEVLAKLVGLSQGQVSRIERNRSEVLRPQVLMRMASVLGVSPETLLPNPTPWRTTPSDEPSQGEVFRVGFWESIWTAPVIGVRDELPVTTHLSSRGRVGGLGTVITPELQRDPNSRPLTPRELVKALRAGYFTAVLVPKEVMLLHPDELTECAEVALAVDGVHIAVCSENVSGPDGVWDRIRDASLAAPVPVCFPADLGAIETVHRLRDALDGRVEVHAVPAEKWPAFSSETTDLVAPIGRPVIAVAPEPHLDAWKRSVWEANSGHTIAMIDLREICPDSALPVSAVSLIFHRERCDAWLTSPSVYEFLLAVEQQASEIGHHSPQALRLLEERLLLDVPTILRECARCDFTTRFTPSWVAQLREHSIRIAG